MTTEIKPLWLEQLERLFEKHPSILFTTRYNRTKMPDASLSDLECGLIDNNTHKELGSGETIYDAFLDATGKIEDIKKDNCEHGGSEY